MTLRREILSCRRCPSMEGCRRVPGAGRRGAGLFFLAEAPGRLGAARTGRPFAGDRSGDLFFEMLAATGLRRDRIFVTNVVKCNPLDARGRNRRPLPGEVAACRPFWRRELARVRPALVVPLGDVACREVVGRPLAAARGRVWSTPCGPAFPLYHPAYVVRHSYGRDRYLADWEAMVTAWAGAVSGSLSSASVVQAPRKTAPSATTS